MLNTPRLRLRPLTASPADVEAWIELHADPRVNEFTGSYTEQQAVDRLRQVEQQWAERGHGLFAVESCEDGRVLGRTGLQYWEQWDEIEAAWVYRFDAHGRGYATEAAQAFIPWGWQVLGLQLITAMISPENLASIRVAERLGFVERSRELRLDHEVILYVLERPQS